MLKSYEHHFFFYEQRNYMRPITIKRKHLFNNDLNVNNNMRTLCVFFLKTLDLRR